MIADLRYALRMLLKSPGFALTAIVVLALGIGGVTAMFGVLYAVMIRPLPYPSPDRLVLGRETNSGYINPWFAGPDYADYREMSRSFSALEAYFCSTNEVTIAGAQPAHRAVSLIVSAGLFSTLGADMFLGRSFAPEEGKAGAPSAAIVSYAYWRDHLSARPDAIGSPLAINGVSRTLVGVTRPEFHFIFDADIWLPMRPADLGPRRFHNWFILGRLKDGVSAAEAQIDVDAIAARLEKDYPDTNAGRGLLLAPLQGAFAEQYRASFFLLCGAAAAILLIACANAAGLLLARGASRQSELAVRSAMGATRLQIMRLLLIEALVLACVAGAAGAILALWIEKGLLLWMPIETLLIGDTGLSIPALGIVLATTVLTGLGCGLLPAWRIRSGALAQDARDAGRGASAHASRLRSALVIGQMALSFVLLVVAGLFVRSLDRLRQEDAGFNSRNLLTAEVALPPRDYSESRRIAFFASLIDRVKSLPGVQSATAISQLPLRNPWNNIDIRAAGTSLENGAEIPSGNQRTVLPGYFETMGIPLLAGRDIRSTDTRGGGRVLVVSKSLAKDLFPGRDPLGQQVVIDRGDNTTWEIVGVVGDIKANSLQEDKASRGTFYRPYAQQSLATMRLAIRTAGDPLAVVAPLRKLLRELDPRIPLSGPRTMEEIMANATVSEKAQSFCLSIFSLLALALEAIGLYGLLAYVVTRQQREIGVRMALGAEPRAILGMVLRSGANLLGIGLGIGLAGALAVARMLRSQIFGVSPYDALTLASVILLLTVVTCIACWLPARRAAKVDPMTALRAE